MDFLIEECDALRGAKNMFEERIDLQIKHITEEALSFHEACLEEKNMDTGFLIRKIDEVNQIVCDMCAFSRIMPRRIRFLQYSSQKEDWTAVYHCLRKYENK